jgi:Protein of unknown function (DUF3237)
MMRDVFGQAPSLLSRQDLSLPEGVVPAGTAPVVSVAVEPKHPSNVVLVQVRNNGGPATFLRAVSETEPFQAAQQRYRAALPIVDDGRRVDYRVELTRAGQLLARLPADGSWLTVTGQRAVAALSAEPGRGPSVTGAAIWGYDLSFFATLIVNLRAEILGETPEGYRVNFFVKNGRVVGPHINAVVRPEGGDWMAIRSDGIGMVDIRITYETSDGALIYEHAGGVFDLGADGYAKVASGQFTGSPPFYPTPSWSTAHPNWKWLNRCQGFGIGRVVLDNLQVQCDIYIPQVLSRLSDG